MGSFKGVCVFQAKLEFFFFVERGKYPEKNPLSRDENRQHTQPTFTT